MATPPNPVPAPAPRKPQWPSSGPSAGPKPKIQTVTQGDVGVVSILEARILDEASINAMGKALLDLVKKQYMIKMVIDLGEVKYLSSAFLRQLIALYKALKEEKGDLRLCRVDPQVREVFKITQLDKMIEIHDTLQKAVESLKQKR